MDRNREITRIKREEIRRLKEHLTLLQQRLERYNFFPFVNQGQQSSLDSQWESFLLPVYSFPLPLCLMLACLSVCFSACPWLIFHCSFRYLSYGSGPKRFPLADVLQYAMEFASSKPVCTSPVEDIDSSAPPGGTAGHPLPPPRWVFRIINLLFALVVFHPDIYSCFRCRKQI